MVINRTVPWPIPPQYAASYWDQLRTHQRFRGEVKCPGCKDSIPLTLDREPMSMGLLPSAVTLPMRCQYCCGQLAIGFCWVSWRVFALRYQPPRVCRVRRAGGEA
jgi:hypothetical protein